jgi:benzoate membrane transport protein
VIFSSQSSSGMFLKNFLRIPRFLNVSTIGTGTVAAVIACTGPLLIVITAAQNGYLTSSETFSWLFGIYVFGGLYGTIMSLRFGKPIAGAYSIPSAVLMTEAIVRFSFNEAVAAYVAAGLLMFIIGLFGWFQKIIRWLPMEIVMAMIAGAMIHFATDMLTSLSSLPVIGGIVLLTYFFTSRWFASIPPIVGALAAGLTSFIILGNVSINISNLNFQLPSIWMPDFSISAIFSISLPIVVMLLGTEAAQGIMVLKNAGYKVPTNSITVNNGLSTMLAGVFGGHSACIGGIMSAICSDESVGPKEGRYAASFVAGIWLIGFGLFSSIVLGLVLLLPKALISLIAGLALITVLLKSLQRAFHGKDFQMGAFFSLIIAMSDITLFGISSTFLALVGGWVISWILEPKDFKKYREQVDHKSSVSA